MLTIAFSDFVHTGHSCNSMPYGIALVAAYAKKIFGDAIGVEIYKYPADLLANIESSKPKIFCFSNYIWNTELSCEIAHRIKRRFPKAIIIFGGPNYPIEPNEQLAYLATRPFIDFFIYKDGEIAFSRLIGKLIQYELNVEVIRSQRITSENVHYVVDGELTRGMLLPVLDDLDQIPSPYLTGLLDKFFERGLIPLTQTTRGCPYSCTYCQDGDDYANKVKRYSRARIDDELEYIAQRARAPILNWGDLNFGMYKEDLETCRTIAKLKKQYGWPQSLDINGKNKKERILEAARIIDGDDLSGGAVTLVAAVQSTDPEVLKHIKRDNVSIDVMLDLAKNGGGAGTSSFSEVILGLPGDTRSAHFKSVTDLMECGINVIRSHQFIMLPGSEASTQASRAQFGMQTRFRVTPRTVVPYDVFGEKVFAPEIDEICVATNTLSYSDYVDCRVFNLTVEIFYNYGLFAELLGLLRRYAISIPSLMLKIHSAVVAESSPLAEIVKGFVRETNELFDSREKIDVFLAKQGTLDRYMRGELGNNEQMMYRALAVFNHMAVLHDLAFDAARSLLGQEKVDAQLSGYLDELQRFSLLRKMSVLSMEEHFIEKFSYDFCALLTQGFADDPKNYFRDDGVRLAIAHSAEQQRLIKEYIALYGLDTYGLGSILGSQTNVNSFYRQVEYS